MSTLMESVKLLNCLIDRFRWPRPHIDGMSETAVRFTMGCRRYIVLEGAVLEIVDGFCFVTDHSEWVAGILDGGVRDDSGRIRTRDTSVQGRDV